MMTARRNYLMLTAVSSIAVLIYFTGSTSEILYGVTSIFILAALTVVSYCVQSDVEDVVVEMHFKRQQSIVMSFIVAGILSAVHSFTRYHVQPEWISITAGLATWLTYAFGVVYLLLGSVKYLRGPGQAQGSKLG